MSEFDDLLEGVLSQYANPEIPVGMEKRIGAALPPAMERVPKLRFLYEAIAALVLLGTTGLLHERHRTTAIHLAVPNETPIAEAANREVATAPVAVARQESERRRASVLVARGGRSPAHSSEALLPLTIVPLTIESIEVASLKFGSPTEEPKEEGAWR